MATYYVDPVSGSDAAAGTSFGTAWQTTQKAADTAVAGDEVRLCATGTETPSATIDFDTNAGANGNPIRFIAYDATGTSPLTSGHYTISGSSLPASTSLVKFTLAVYYVEFHGVRFTAGTLHNIEATNDNWAIYSTFVRCRIDNAASLGVACSAGWTHVRFINCEIDHNGSSGWSAGTSTNRSGECHFLGCSFHHNGASGIWTIRPYYFSQCQFYRNTSDGITMFRQGPTLKVDHCTFYGNGGDGIGDGGSTIIGNIMLEVTNSTFVANGGYGIVAPYVDGYYVIDYNHFHDNTSGSTSGYDSDPPGDYNQTGDPLFASTTDGSEDFTPADGSPLDGTGFNGSDIGAVGTADPAGGGGGTYAWAN